MSIEIATWLLWSITCAYGVRWAIVRLLRPRFGGWSFLIAYATWVLLFAVGCLVFFTTGFDFKRPPGSAEGGELLVYIICIWSPLGLPIISGAGPVIIWDAVIATIRKIENQKSLTIG